MAANPPADLSRVLDAMGSELVTAAELAERLGVCERTIYRCVQRLRRRGHRIAASSGVGYMLRQPQVAEAHDV